MMSAYHLDVIVIVLFCLWSQARAKQISMQENMAEYCESEKFQAKCSENEAILMTAAKYGRMELGRCITQSYGHIGCSMDVLDVMDSFCSGRSSCSIIVSHPALIKKKGLSCPKDFAAYLVASYTCVVASSIASCDAKGHVQMAGNNGYISAIPKRSTAVGTYCPVIIQSPNGQQINITMFSFLPTPSSDQSLGSSSACYEIGTILDKDASHTIHKCLNDQRHKSILVTNGNHIEVKVTSSQTTETSGAFLLHYKVVGCIDPEIPDKSKLDRTGDRAQIICESSGDSWNLICKENKWVGELGTCKSGSFFSEDGWSFFGLFDHSHPYGTAIVVGIGATVGVLIGGILLYIIIAIVKRCQREDYRNYEYTDNNFTHVPVDFHGDKTDLVFNDGNNSQFGTWGPRSTLSRNEHARMPLPPLPKDNNTLSYEKPLINKNGNGSSNIL